MILKEYTLTPRRDLETRSAAEDPVACDVLLLSSLSLSILPDFSISICFLF